MRQKLLTILVPVGFALALLLPTGGAEALTLSPPQIDHAINPGDTIMEVLKLYNEDRAAAMTLYAIPMNFRTSGDEGGVPSFYPAFQDPEGAGLGNWIEVDQSAFQIAPGERLNIPITIKVPKDANPGGHFGAVIFSSAPPDAYGNMVSLVGQMATLIFIRVSGDVKEVGSIAEFGFKKPQIWYNYRPIDFFLRFENSGNVHLRPTGNLFIYNWYGRQVADIKVNQEFGSVLPRSIRRFEFGWRGVGWVDGDSELMKEWRNFAIGRYHAVLALNYGADNKVITDQREFTVWPWRLMLVGGAVLLVLILLVILLIRLYGKSVIRGYEKRRGKVKKAEADREGEMRSKLEQELRAKIEKEMREKMGKETK